MRIDNNTKLVTLLGRPVSQSYSTRLQNAAYEAMGANMVYLAQEVDQESLGTVIQGLRRMNFAGSAVTKPDKVAVMQYLDEVDGLCGMIGACNTVVNRDGRLIGYNTDAAGFYESMVEDGRVQPAGNTFFCIGAGGVGRAMCAVLAVHGAEKIYVTDYYDQAARELCRDLNEKTAPVFEFVPNGDYTLVPECGVVMNASGIGMGSTIGRSPIPAGLARPGQLYFDACYNPDRTRFLLDAQAGGARTLNGLGMFVRQGAAQIRLWTGETPPLDVMKRELSAVLEKRRPEQV